MKPTLCLFLLAVLSCGFSQEKVADSEVRRIPIDPDRVEFDTDVQFAFVEKELGWAVWKGYRMGHESVWAKPLRLDPKAESRTGRAIELTSSSHGIFGLSLGLEKQLNKYVDQPLIARWSERDRNGEWKTFRLPLADPKKGLMLYPEIPGNPGMRSTGDPDLEVWQEMISPGKTLLHWSPWHSTGQGDPAEVTSGETPAFHPTFASIDEKNSWMFWDEYKDGGQWIAGRRIHPEPGDPTRISPPDPNTRCLNPVPLATDNNGLCVAWIKLTDVIGGEGVIDMIHTAHVAALDSATNEWDMITDADGSDEGAGMLNGLLPDLRKGKGYPSGYSGNRRKPMLLDAGEDGVWMIWERKSKHSGGGTKTAGQLLGRRFQNGKWVGAPLLLHEGLIDYRLASPHRVRPDRHNFFVVGSEIPHSWKRPSYLVEVDLRKAAPIELDDWRDQFKPVTLPFPDEPERYTATPADGKKYQLFWGDLHCHSGLTGDAEGEPDEIVLYARDRAKLDVMVLQDNDEVHGRILTEGEYQMGVTHSQWITEPGKFVALPGYEWTQRTSLKGVPRPYDPVHEQTIKGGFPNHRTVIYPIEGGPIVRFFEVGHQFDVMADRVQKADGILHSQHPAFHLSDHPAETNLEVTACWGIYIRSVPALFHNELDKGRHMGFIGTSDSHRRNPGLCGGLTGIYAEELTPEAIHRALKEHRVFATNGSKIVIDSRADNHFSDKVVKVSDGKIGLSLKVIGTSPVTSVRLMGTGGKTLAKFEGNGSREREFTFSANDLKPGKHWFYWAIEQEGSSKQYSGNISVARGNLAWSSPHLVEVE